MNEKSNEKSTVHSYDGFAVYGSASGGMCRSGKGFTGQKDRRQRPGSKGNRSCHKQRDRGLGSGGDDRSDLSVLFRFGTG